MIVTLLAVLAWVPLMGTTRLGLLIGRRVATTPRLPGADFFARLADVLARFAKPISFASILVVVGLGLFALRLRPDSRLLESVLRGSDVRAALLDADRRFGGVLPNFALIEWSDELALTSPSVWSAIGDVQEAFRSQEMISHPLSIRDVVAAAPPFLRKNPEQAIAAITAFAPDLVNRFALPERHRAIVWGYTQDAGTAAYEPIFAELRQRLATIDERYPNLSISLTGIGVVATDTLQGMISQLARSLALASVMIFGVIGIAFRSVRLGIIAVIPNFFPIAFTSALLVWTGQPLQLTSAIVFTVCLGIATDDTIHLITRFQRERFAGADVPQAVKSALMHVGSAVLTTTAVLVIPFAMLNLSLLPSMRIFGTLLAAGLIAAFIGDLIILPALLAVFAPRSKNIAT